MNQSIMIRLQSRMFWLGMIGAVKLASESFGIQWITDEQLNAIADGFAALFTVIGVVSCYTTKDEPAEPEAPES